MNEKPRILEKTLKKVLRIVIWVLGLAMIAGLVYLATKPQPIAVDVAAAKRGPLEVTIDEDGLTRIKERYVVSTPLAGRLERVALEVGDQVTEGTTAIARMQAGDPSLLDPRAIAQARARVSAAGRQLDVALAEKEKAESAEKFARIMLNRVEQLHETKVIAEADREARELEFRIRHEEARAANFQVDIAEYELELQRAALLLTDPAADSKSPGDIEMELSIKAPINGRVLRVYHESSAVLDAGEPIMEIGDPRDLEIVVDVLSVDAVRIHAGDRVSLENWGGEKSLAGEVRVVEPSGFTKLSALGVEEQRVNVIVDLLDPREQHQSLGDGFRVDARIIIWSGNGVLCVPTSSLFRTAADWTLFRVSSDQRAELVQVQIGHNNGIQAEVLSGLEAGDTVIVHPSDKLADGVAIELRE